MGQCDAPSVMLSIGLGEVIRATGKINFIFREEVIGRNWSREIKRKAGILANETKQRRGSGSVSLKVNSLIF